MMRAWLKNDLHGRFSPLLQYVILSAVLLVVGSMSFSRLLVTGKFAEFMLWPVLVVAAILGGSEAFAAEHKSAIARRLPSRVMDVLVAKLLYLGSFFVAGIALVLVFTFVYAFRHEDGFGLLYEALPGMLKTILFCSLGGIAILAAAACEENSTHGFAVGAIMICVGASVPARLAIHYRGYGFFDKSELPVLYWTFAGAATLVLAFLLYRAVERVIRHDDSDHAFQWKMHSTIAALVVLNLLIAL
jgi:hypothetical protein